LTEETWFFCVPGTKPATIDTYIRGSDEPMYCEHKIFMSSDGTLPDCTTWTNPYGQFWNMNCRVEEDDNVYANNQFTVILDNSNMPLTVNVSITIEGVFQFYSQTLYTIIGTPTDGDFTLPDVCK